MVKKPWAILWLFIILVCISALTGCSDNTTAVYDADLKSIEPFGQIPESFQNIIDNNLFNGITAFDGRLLKAEILSEDPENKAVTHKVRMMDVYGNDLAEYICTSDDAYHITTLTATADGGFLFTLGFSDYAYDQNTWASDNGFASRVIKCDKDGKLQFDTAFEHIEGSALYCCFEFNGRFYLFGDRQTPETKHRGTYSSTDIYMVILDQNGGVLKSQSIAGSDFDSLDAAERIGNEFRLSVSSQSDDGDFAGSGSKGFPIDWVITVNEELEITKKEKAAGRAASDYRIGEKDGVSLYKSDIQDFDAGTPTAWIDYGDFYLVVSENRTGVYENTPLVISSIWYYTQTVYSAYDDSGELIFRASADSTPDYDAYVDLIIGDPC